jgi:hypothetical protein
VLYVIRLLTSVGLTLIFSFSAMSRKAMPSLTILCTLGCEISLYLRYFSGVALATHAGTGG